MTIDIESRGNGTADLSIDGFSAEDTIRTVTDAFLAEEGCPYDVSLSVCLTDNAGIRECNRTYRGIDRETDVLSFPAVEYPAPGDFDILEDMGADAFDPETGELILGDIMISVERAKTQAEEYGHSLRREIAFLTVHSLLHLIGYDHESGADRTLMEERQRNILDGVGIRREEMGQ